MSNISIISYIILSLAVLYSFAYPKFNQVNSLNQEKNKYEEALETVRNIENRKNELLRQYNNISEQDKKRIESVLPNSLDLIKLVSEIDSVASRYGISINNISSSNQSDSIGNSVKDAKSVREFQSAIIGFSFDATYEKFLIFIDDLEKNLRVMDLRSLKLETKENNFSYKVEFEVYWLNKENNLKDNNVNTNIPTNDTNGPANIPAPAQMLKQN